MVKVAICKARALKLWFRTKKVGYVEFLIFLILKRENGLALTSHDLGPPKMLVGYHYVANQCNERLGSTLKARLSPCQSEIFDFFEKRFDHFQL